MSLETGITFINGRIAKGNDIAATIEEGIVCGIYGHDVAEQLRQRYLPSPPPYQPVSNEDVQKVNNAEIAAVPPVTSQKSEPKLLIDWGGVPKIGIDMTPSFTILDYSSNVPPLVFKAVDSRIDSAGKKGAEKSDQLVQVQVCHKPQGWGFSQAIHFDKAGQFQLKFVLIDPKPDSCDPDYYRCDCRITVDATNDNSKRRTLEINADGPLATNLNLKGFDEVKVVTKGTATIHTQGDSPITQQMLESLGLGGTHDEQDEDTTTIPFYRDKCACKNVPYISRLKHAELTSRLTMTEFGRKKTFELFSGTRMTFGRNVPEQQISNDFMLSIAPPVQDAMDHGQEILILDRLFSREHARLEAGDGGIYIDDIRKAGISDATIVDGTALARNGCVILFHNPTNPPNVGSDKPRAVLFSKMLSMQMTPYSEKMWPDRFPPQEPLPIESLNALYPLQSKCGITSVRITPEELYQNKKYAGQLSKIINSSSPMNPWLEKWLSSDHVDPRFGMIEYWFIPTCVTIGSNRDTAAIRLDNRNWGGTRFRILCIDQKMFIENVSQETDVYYKVGNTEQIILPYRPLPLVSGTKVFKGSASLDFK